jgi:hypothetical protein
MIMMPQGAGRGADHMSAWTTGRNKTRPGPQSRASVNSSYTMREKGEEEEKEDGREKVRMHQEKRRPKKKV